MSDRERFIDDLSLFLDSEDTTALITGLDDDTKIRMALAILNSKYTRGTMYVNAIGNISFLLNRAFGVKKKIFPSTISRNEQYKVGNLNLSFEKYSGTNSEYPFDKEEFAIYYPVESVLLDEKAFKRIRKHIENNKTRKILIITTNDHHKDTSKLDSLVDQHIHYETMNDNRELYETVKMHINNGHNEFKVNNIYNDMIE